MAIRLSNEIYELVRLLGELAVYPGEFAAKRRYLMAGLNRVLEGDAWIWFYGSLNGKLTGDHRTIDGSWKDNAQRDAICAALFDPYIQKHVALPLASQLQTGRNHVTSFRRDLVCDRTFYSSAHYRTCLAPMGLDDCILSFTAAENRRISGLYLFRSKTKPCFKPEHRELVHLITDQIPWVHCEKEDIPEIESLLNLSPRQRQVLIHLLNGDSRKQIAQKLRLSIHTVNDHVKALHRQFDVNSRGELIARLISSDIRLSSVN